MNLKALSQCLMRGCFVAMALLPIGFAGAEDEERLKETALAQAKVVEAAFNARRYDIVLAMSPKKLRDAVGSAESVEQMMAASLGQGVVFGSVEVVGVLSIAAFEGECFVTLSKKMQVMVEDGKCLIEGGLLGISSNGGKTWEFMDISPNIRKQTEAFSKQLMEKLVFPETRMINGDFVFIRQGDEWRPDAATLKMMREALNKAQKRK